MSAVSAWDAALDLFLGSRCVGCAAPGRALCPACDAALPVAAGLAWPTPAPAGLVPPWAAGAYDGALRALVVAHKEEQRLALARPLGRLLAVSAAAAVAAGGRPPGPVVALVPVPSHPAVVRRRGHDPLLRATRHAAATLRAAGVAAQVRPVLRVRGRPGDQAGLTSHQRAANVAGRFTSRRVAAAIAPGTAVLLVDDVVTTGATLREAQRALEEAGVEPDAAALVAATQRRAG